MDVLSTQNSNIYNRLICDKDNCCKLNLLFSISLTSLFIGQTIRVQLELV